MSTWRVVSASFLGALVLGAPALLAQWPTSPSFRVNDPSRLTEISKAVALDQAGRFWVLDREWTQLGPNLFTTQVVARRYGPQREELTGSIVLNSPQGSCCAGSPAVGSHRTGDALLAWFAPWEGGPPGSPGAFPGGGPYARVYSESEAMLGSAVYLPEGSDQHVGQRIRAKSRADGSYVVSWQFSNSTEPPSFNMSTGSFHADGTPMAPAFEIDGNVWASNESWVPTQDVAGLPGGRLFAVWSKDGADGDRDGILGRIFEADGTPVTPAFVVNTHTARSQFYPSIAADAAGRSVVVWDSAGQDGSGEGVYAQRFDPSGARVGPELRLSSDAPSAQLEADVAMDWAGNFVAVWWSPTELLPVADYNHVFGRAFRADGTPHGEQFWISSDREPSDRNELPVVALSDAGTFVVGFQSLWLDPEVGQTSYDVFARTFALSCVADERTLCLREGRFLVRAFYRAGASGEGAARALPLTGESGGFWFFWPGNFELLVKVLDGCEVNGNFWLYAAGLTDVEVDLIVTDTWTGRVRTYRNPAGTPYAPVQRVADLGTCEAPPPPGAAAAPVSTSPAAGVAGAGAAAAALPEPTPAAAAGGAGSCVDSATELCLTGERFRVTAEWEDFTGGSGAARAVPFGSDSGLFWFFGEDNLELAVKVLDGCGVNDRFWVYAAGLTNVRVRLRVEDTSTGALWIRDNPAGRDFQPLLDPNALDGCGAGT